MLAHIEVCSAPVAAHYMYPAALTTHGGTRRVDLARCNLTGV